MSDRNCKCPIDPAMDYDQLIKHVVPHNCCDPYYMCSTLDKTLRRAKDTKDIKDRQAKKKHARNV